MNRILTFFPVVPGHALAALAEVSWSTSRRTSYDDFVRRITKALLPIYSACGYNYADYAFRKPPVEWKSHMNWYIRESFASVRKSSAGTQDLRKSE